MQKNIIVGVNVAKILLLDAEMYQRVTRVINNLM